MGLDCVDTTKEPASAANDLDVPAAAAVPAAAIVPAAAAVLQVYSFGSALGSSLSYSQVLHSKPTCGHCSLLLMVPAVALLSM